MRMYMHPKCGRTGESLYFIVAEVVCEFQPKRGPYIDLGEPLKPWTSGWSTLTGNYIKFSEMNIEKWRDLKNMTVQVEIETKNREQRG